MAKKAELKKGRRAVINEGSSTSNIPRGSVVRIIEAEEGISAARVYYRGQRSLVSSRNLEIITKKDRKTGLDVYDTLADMVRANFGLQRLDVYDWVIRSGANSGHLYTCERTSLPLDFSKPDSRIFEQALRDGIEAYALVKAGGPVGEIMVDPRGEAMSIFSLSAFPGLDEDCRASKAMLKYAVCYAYFEKKPILFKTWTRHPCLESALRIGFTKESEQEGIFPNRELLGTYVLNPTADQAAEYVNEIMGGRK